MEVDPPGSIHLTFSFEAGVLPSESDKAARLSFWSLPTTIEWFKQRGYILYEGIEDGISKPALPFNPYNEAQYPYACYDTLIYHTQWTVEPLLAHDTGGKVVYAQDALNRHVVIKVVHADTDEYRVLKFLNDQSLDVLRENCVIPVLDLLPTGGYWFAVMPRWGTEIYFPCLKRSCEPVDIIHSMLKGLAFLHNNNIAHGDISLNNVVINHFSSDDNTSYNATRAELRLDRRLSYALIDFDFATMLPPNVDKREFRLPYDRSFGTFNLSDDTAAGEYDYDPFAFDVGAMGVTLDSQYGSLIEAFPGLAPLFDMMTTWDIPRRFTASQALEFFEARLSELSEEQLQVSLDDLISNRFGWDPWKTLPPDLADKWKMYKTMPLPLSLRLLRWIACRRWMCHIVPWTRWICFQTFSVFPRQIYRWFYSSKISL